MSQLSGLGQTMLQLSGLKQTVLQLLDKSVLEFSVTALFYLEDNRKIHLQGVRACRCKDATRRVPQHVGEREREKERERVIELTHVWGRERERALCILFLYVSFSPLGLPYANWAQSGLLLYLKSSLRSSDLSLTFFCSIFAGFSLPCLLAPAILVSCFLF